MRAEHYRERQLELAGWPVRVRTYRIGATWYAKADNVSPGAEIAAARADSMEEAEQAALEKAGRRLAATRRIR